MNALSRLGAACVAFSLVAAGAWAAPGPAIMHAEFGGEIVKAGSEPAGVLYQDGAQSFAVPGGTLWTFGDTFLGHRPDASARSNFADAISNSIAFLSAGSHEVPPKLQYLTGPDGMAKLALVPGSGEDPKRHRMWPLGGIALGQSIYLFYSMVETTNGPPGWNFRVLGAGLAVADKPLSVFHRCQPQGTWRYPVEPNCVLAQAGFVYCFEASGQASQRGLVIARVRPGQIEDPGAYRFFNGKDWVADRESARVVLGEVYGQVSIAWNPALKAWLMATSSNPFRPPEIQFRTATDLWGPWSEPVRLAIPERPGKKTNLVYCTFIHPELPAADGRETTLTFCRQLAGNWELSNPEWLRVRWKIPQE